MNDSILDLHTTPPRRIMAPIDFSEPSILALRHAIKVAHQFGAILQVVHVAEAPPAPRGLTAHEYMMDQQHRTAKNTTDIRTLVESLTQGTFAGTLEIIALEGTPSQEIARLATENQSDLIIISTHGRTGFKRFMLGSTADKVVRLSPCSVLVVKEKH